MLEGIGLRVFSFFADWVIGLFRARKVAKQQIVARRFVQLFEMHGVNRNQIPRFIDNSLTLATLQNNAKLLEVLTNERLEAAAQLFDVRVDWLEGATDEIYADKGNFYKHPEGFAEFVDKVLARSDNVRGLLLVGDVNRKGKDTACDAFLVIAEAVGHLGDKTIYCYHVCDAWVFSYWKCRAYLTACIAIAWKKGVYIHGKYVSAKALEGVAERTTLPILENFQGKHWDPEYMAIDPELYLNGLDEGGFGKAAALELWLELEAEGWMNYGGGTHREAFFGALKKDPDVKSLKSHKNDRSLSLKRKVKVLYVSVFCVAVIVVGFFYLNRAVLGLLGDQVDSIDSSIDIPRELGYNTHENIKEFIVNAEGTLYSFESSKECGVHNPVPIFQNGKISLGLQSTRGEENAVEIRTFGEIDILISVPWGGIGEFEYNGNMYKVSVSRVGSCTADYRVWTE